MGTRTPGPGQTGGEPAIEMLARLIAAYAPHDGSFDLSIPGVHVGRFSRINKAAHVVGDDGRGQRKPARGLPERFAVQQGIQPFLWKCAHAGHRQIAARRSSLA